VTAGRPVGEAKFVREILLPVRTPSLRRVFHDSDHAECHKSEPCKKLNQSKCAVSRVGTLKLCVDASRAQSDS